MIPINQDYYNILGVNKNSEENEIKKSYYKLCLKWHPDKNKQAGAEDKFKEINRAYEVLSDPSKRSMYDLQNDSDYKSTAKNYRPKSENFTFYQANNEDNKWNQFNKKTEQNSANNNNNNNNESGNGGSYRKNFYKQYKKYFDSGLFFDIESDNDIEENMNSNNDNDDEYESDFDNESNHNNNQDSKSYKQKDYSAYFNRANSDDRESSKTSFRFHPSDPFELLETFAMYRLFSEMSSRLFEDVNDEEMLINLAKIISSFNFPDRKESNTSGTTRENTSTSFRNNNNDAKKQTNSDFVYDETKFKSKSNENKLPKMSATSNTDWEFEWLGKSSGKKSTSPLPPFVRTDSEPEEESNTTYYANESFESNDKNSFYECYYCNKVLNDKESLDKHQSICKRLSHNIKLKSKYNNTSSSSNEMNTNRMNESTTSSTFSSSNPSTSSSPLITECSKCKLSMSTYDYLLHHCKPATVKPNLDQPIYKPSNRYKDILLNNNNNNKNTSAFKPVHSQKPYFTTNTANNTASKQTFNHSDFVFSKIKSSQFNKTPNIQTSSTSPKRSSRLSNETENQSKIYSKKATNYDYTRQAAAAAVPSSSSSSSKHMYSSGYSSSSSINNNNNNNNNKYKLHTPMTFTSYASSKPYSPIVTNPVYSTRLSNRNSTSTNSFSNGKYNTINLSTNTGLKREKLRTGF